MTPERVVILGNSAAALAAARERRHDLAALKASLAPAGGGELSTQRLLDANAAGAGGAGPGPAATEPGYRTTVLADARANALIVRAAERLEQVAGAVAATHASRVVRDAAPDLALVRTEVRLAGRRTHRVHGLALRRVHASHLLASHEVRLDARWAELGLADVGTTPADPALFGYTLENVLERLVARSAGGTVG